MLQLQRPRLKAGSAAPHGACRDIGPLDNPLPPLIGKGSAMGFSQPSLTDPSPRTHTLYIGGAWSEPDAGTMLDVVNPATEAVLTQVALGSGADVDRAVAAARSALPAWSATSPADRKALLEQIHQVYSSRLQELADTISAEMGAPKQLALLAQAGSGLAHLSTAIELLDSFEFTEQRGTSIIVHEPIGVCGLITPWNWPANQIMCKVAPAIAAGCTMVLKPSEVTPLNALLLTEIFDEAGVPAGVFNLVIGDGPTVGAAISAHPDIDMVSFTGSTRAGVAVAQAAAPSVKRVTQELGGKSANIILRDADLERAVKRGVLGCFQNSGQSCNAPTRMLVNVDQYDEAVEFAAATARKVTVGDPNDDSTSLGPVASQLQFDKVQMMIQAGIDEGATVIAGGMGRPEGLTNGYFVRPTVFANVTNDMRIAREEIFGPVLVMIPYADEDEAVAIANDTEYGLSGYVQAGDVAHAAEVGARIRAGEVHLNGAGPDFAAPFGGYKQSGNGREWGAEGMAEFLETKSLLGANPQQ